jgi:hypothetical protein
VRQRQLCQVIGYRPSCCLGRRFDVGVREKRFACELWERIGQAIAEIQFGRMTAAFAEIAIGLPCNSSLGFRHGFNSDLRLFDQVIDPRLAMDHGSRLR